MAANIVNSAFTSQQPGVSRAPKTNPKTGGPGSGPARHSVTGQRSVSKTVGKWPALGKTKR